MFLNSGSCLGLFNAYKSDGVKQKEIYDAIFSAIKPHDETDYNPSNIKSGKADIPTSIKTALRDPNLRQDQIIRFKKTVTPLIENNLRILIGSFLLFFEKDKTIADNVSIAGKPIKEWKTYRGVVQTESFLVGVISFACLRGKKQPDLEEYLFDSFKKKAKSRGTGITLQDETLISTPTQTITIETADFSATFHEVPLCNNQDKIKLRLFLLDYDCNKFIYGRLISYFRENLFRHVHTINELNGYTNEGALAAMHLDARSKLDKEYQLSHDSILDTLLVESCITEASHAPKIINILEHNSSGVPTGSHGIHYLKRTVKGKTDYQIVVAIAAIQDNKREALSCIFKDIRNVDSTSSIWRTALFSQQTLLTRIPPDDAKWIADTFVPKNLYQKVPTTRYGIFLGYSENCIGTSNSIENDIANKMAPITSEIQSYISDVHLESSEFDVYVIPFNNVKIDKKQIIEGVLS